MSQWEIRQTIIILSFAKLIGKIDIMNYCGIEKKKNTAECKHGNCSKRSDPIQQRTMGSGQPKVDTELESTLLYTN